MDVSIRNIDAGAIADNLPGLNALLIDTVAEGGAIGFMHPVSESDAGAFWLSTVGGDVAAGNRVLFIATSDGVVAGAVQLIVALPPNQPHRCEIAKMMVHPSARRNGTGRRLLGAAIEMARGMGKTLMTLDTRTGDVAEGVYARLGFRAAGSIPDYAWDPDGGQRHATTYMFMAL